MIAVEQAEHHILEALKDFPVAKVPLSAAFGRVLREDITADRDHPPGDRATMDGIAVSAKAVQAGRRQFAVAGIQAAGQPAFRLTDPDTCFEIMTGALLPDGCDCVIPIEQVDLTEGVAVLKGRRRAKAGQFIHQAGADYIKGVPLLNAGQLLDAPAVLTTASVGKTDIKVTAAVKIAVIGTGDELVEIDQKLKPHQFRRSNTYALQAALASFGFNGADRFHIRDDRKDLRSSLKSLLNRYDVLILSGGVSMGKFDLVPDSLRELGVSQIFHGVKQKPGGPMWFGVFNKSTPVFALPGNPVSTLICACRYLIPYLLAASGRALPSAEWARLSGNIIPDKALTLFRPVRLRMSSDAVLQAEPAEYTVSGNYAALLGTDGFVEIPPQVRTPETPDAVRLWRWSNGHV